MEIGKIWEYMRINFIKHVGFSLIEIMLVLTVAASMTLLKIRDISEDQENIRSRIVGEQIKSVGNAVNSYIVIRYNQISLFKSSSNSPDDPGPRICSGTICTITTQTLINEGFLPVSFNGKNVNGSDYTIQLKRSGSNPNYVVNGLIVANNPWTDGKTIKFDLIGRAMQFAGSDSGVNKTDTTTTGYAGIWSEKQTDYPSINKKGQMSYRVGYDSSLYSVYLRRDGGLPMTGDLNMDGHNINNVAGLNATGNIVTSGNISGKNITATSDLNVSNNAIVGNNIEVGNNIKAKGNIGTYGYEPDDIPKGWYGGLRTWDVVASGTIVVLTEGKKATDGDYMTLISQKGYINTKGSINATGDKGIITASGNITSGGVVSGNTLLPKSTVVVGSTCATIGEISKDAEGYTLSCQSGKWARQYHPSVTMRDDGVWAANSDFQACNSDEVVVGGGGQCEDPSHHYIHYSAPINNGWSIDCFYTSSEYKDLGSRAYALCMKK